MIRNNEKEWVADILATHEKPNNMTMYQLIRFIAMYHYYDWHELKPSQYTRNVLDVMKEFNFGFLDYQEWKFVSYTKRFIKKMIDGKIRHDLLDIKSVSITKKEMDIIRSAETEKQQMVMFTMFVLAKVNLMPSGWINDDLKDVFEYADVKLTKKERHKFIHTLYVQHLIKLNEYPDRRGYQVDLQDDKSDIVMTVTIFEHLGRQYLNKYKDGWKMCENCGKMIKIKAPNQKYCKKCYEYIHEKQKLESKRRLSANRTQPA